MDHVKDKWWIWLGYKEDRSILLSASTTKWEGVCLSRFILTLPGESCVVDAGQITEVLYDTGEIEVQ